MKPEDPPYHATLTEMPQKLRCSFVLQMSEFMTSRDEVSHHRVLLQSRERRAVLPLEPLQNARLGKLLADIIVQVLSDTSL